MPRRTVLAGSLFLALSCQIAGADGRLDLTNIELMLSRGTTANGLTIDARLSGVPQNRQEVRALQIFPVDPNTAVLAFTGSGTSYEGVKRTVILTEDGLWGLAPMTSENGRPYFLSENEIKRIAKDHEAGDPDWAIVTSNFSAADPRFAFSRGEAFPIDATRYAKPAAVLTKGDLTTGSKYSAIAAEVAKNGPSESVLVEEGRFAVLLADDYETNVEKVDALKIIDFLADLQTRESHRIDWLPFGGQEIDPVFKKWRKTIWLREPYRVDCTDEITARQKHISEVSGKISAKFGLPEFLKTVSSLGFSVDAEMSTVQSWTSDLDQVSKIEDQSFDTDSYLFGSGTDPVVFSFGNAAKCPTATNDITMKFFTATIPGIAGTALSVSDLQDIDELDDSIRLLKSGYLETSCSRAGYQKIIAFLTDDLTIDPPMARVIAGSMVKIKLKTFLTC